MFALVLGGCEGTIHAPVGGSARGSSDARFAPTTDIDPNVPAEVGPATRDDAASEDSANTRTQTCDGAVDVAVVPLRRLTRVEFEHSVADVFEVRGAVAAGLSADERIDGVFASNTSSAVAPVQVRQYLDAAEAIAAQVNIATISPCDRAQNSDDTCARLFIERVGRRAFRRPLDSDETTRYFGLYKAANKLENGYTPALRLVAQTFLQSPHFLYHVELADPSGATQPGDVAALTPYALAARLAFFVWSSAPDDELLDAAGDGALDDREGIAAQLRRMLDDPRASQGIESFHAQWLGLPRLDQASRDPQVFPEWNSDLVAALRGELAKFSDYVIRHEHGDLRELYSADYSFPSGPGLAIRDVTGANSDSPKELDPARSQGLLTQPAFLAAHAHANQTSPILRGRAVRERMFCQPLPDPPPNVAAVAPELADDLTTRERYAMHRTASSACYSCHHLIDDLGFALEHYDALGRYRELENGKAIDATGQLSDTDVDGPLDGAPSLAERLSASRVAQTCYATQWFRYALGRTESTSDRCSLQKVQASFQGDSAIADLLIAIATSDAFTHQKVEE